MQPAFAKQSAEGQCRRRWRVSPLLVGIEPSRIGRSEALLAARVKLKELDEFTRTGRDRGYRSWDDARPTYDGMADEAYAILDR